MNKKIEELLEKSTWQGAPQIGIDDYIDHEKFAILLVEECAKIAEEHSRSFTGEKNEAAGCYGSALAIRVAFGVAK